jgi:hypothetical protein
MKLLMSNATNAIFVGGRGGCLRSSEMLNIRTTSETERALDATHNNQTSDKT